jgi:ADP-heptose:LPS heptosyltransferase
LQEKGFGVVMMSEIRLDLTSEKLKDEVAIPENVTVRQWAAIIKYADHFLGCDSLGQHFSYTLNVPSTVVFGSTYPINVSYPDCEYFNILDMGEELREYSPIRITMDERIDRRHEGLMSMTPEIVEYVIDAVSGKIKE